MRSVYERFLARGRDLSAPRRSRVLRRETVLLLGRGGCAKRACHAFVALPRAARKTSLEARDARQQERVYGAPCKACSVSRLGNNSHAATRDSRMHERFTGRVVNAEELAKLGALNDSPHRWTLMVRGRPASLARTRPSRRRGWTVRLCAPRFARSLPGG